MPYTVKAQVFSNVETLTIGLKDGRVIGIVQNLNFHWQAYSFAGLDFHFIASFNDKSAAIKAVENSHRDFIARMNAPIV